MRVLAWLVSREVRRLRSTLAGARSANGQLAGQLREEQRAHRRTHDTLQALIGRYRDRAEDLARQLREVDGA